mmetsp:Transcript_99890/g.161036  ORF Transcript_99890/g.161036 Transcript_99890/m.161036 type:complete len:447 (+) Transcript_99890:102-1442(+)
MEELVKARDKQVEELKEQLGVREAVVNSLALERSEQEETEKLALRAKPVLQKAVSDEEARRQLAVKDKLVVSLQTELLAQKQESEQELGAQVKAAYNLGKKQELARISATSNASALVEEVQSNGTGVSVAELQKQEGVMAVLRAEKDALKSRVLALESDVCTLNSTRLAEGLDASAGTRSMSGDAERQRVEEIEAKYSMLQGQLKTLQAEKVTLNSSEQGLQARMDALLAEQATKDAQMRKSAYVLQQENEAVADKLQTLAEENTKYKELVDEYLEIGSQAEQELESLTTHSEILQAENSRLKCVVDEYLTIKQEMSEKQTFLAVTQNTSQWQDKLDAALLEKEKEMQTLSAKREAELRGKFEKEINNAIQEASAEAQVEVAKKTPSSTAAALESAQKRENAALAKAAAAEEAAAAAEAQLTREREKFAGLEVKIDEWLARGQLPS